MTDSEPKTKGSCKRSSASSNFVEFLKRKRVGICILTVAWAVTMAVFTLIKDPDWNIAVVPYFFAFVACALVSVVCERGTYNHDRLGDIYRIRINRKRNKNIYFEDSEVSPMLSDASRQETSRTSFCRADPKPLGDSEELFEPAPVLLQESMEGSGCCQRDTQLTVQADVHRPVQEQPSPKTSPEHPGESSSTASASDPHNSSTTPDSGVALQSTPSGPELPIPRPPSSNPGQPQQNPEQQNPEQLQQNPEQQNPEQLQQNPEKLQQNTERLQQNPEKLLQNTERLQQNPEQLQQIPEEPQENPEQPQQNPEQLQQNPMSPAEKTTRF